MKNSKGFIQIIVILIVIALIAVGAYYFGTKNKPIPTSSPITSAQPSASPVVTPTQDPATANWKTYTNSIYNFQFKYPTELALEQTVDPEKGSSIVVSGNLNKTKPDTHLAVVVGYTWGVSMNATGLDAFKSCSTDAECYDLYYQDITQFPRQGIKTISAQIIEKTVKGFEFTDKDQLIRYFPLSRNGKFFLISFTFVNYSLEEISTEQTTVDQILSTFKFTK